MNEKRRARKTNRSNASEVCSNVVKLEILERIAIFSLFPIYVTYHRVGYLPNHQEEQVTLFRPEAWAIVVDACCEPDLYQDP
jgi:hypothetical protein